MHIKSVQTYLMFGFVLLGAHLLSGINQAHAKPRLLAPKPAALHADSIPEIPKVIVERTRPYMEHRSAAFVGWNPLDKSMLIATRFGNTKQLHRVKKPGFSRTQISFDGEPVRRASYAPDGSMLLVQKDVGGNEVHQIYALSNGRLTLLTDGKSRNRMGPWTRDSSLFAYASNKRTGRYNDIYVMDPRAPETSRMLITSTGGGWLPIDFSPDGKFLLVFNYLSANDSQLYLVNVQNGELKLLTDHINPVSYGRFAFDSNGRLWATSDSGSDVQRLGIINTLSGEFLPLIGERWGISDFEISDNGRWIAYEVNEAGRSKMRIYDIRKNRAHTIKNLPPGVIGNFEFAPWGELGLTFSSNQSPSDAYSINPISRKLKRWTTSETGGLDPRANALPELIATNSFDGQRISGFLYRPDPSRHPGKRPLIMKIHGGPESQAKAGFIGRNNYLINELGIAIFYPNVRGSTGFGKRFQLLDNGPERREDSVRDIGAFLQKLHSDSMLDDQRFAITGGSYGGYMTLASLLQFPGRFRAALEVVGITNFVTFLENTQSYRRDLRRAEYGDERNPVIRAKLEQISPLRRAKEIVIPLMIVTGANDPRVPASEADQLIKAVQKNGGDVWHLLARNEGHGFRRKENIDYQFWASLMFWQRNLLQSESVE